MKIVCPMCRKVKEDVPDDFPPRPFCSPQCKLADLDNWLSGTYRISEPQGPDDIAVEPDPGPDTH